MDRMEGGSIGRSIGGGLREGEREGGVWCLTVSMIYMYMYLSTCN